LLGVWWACCSWLFGLQIMPALAAEWSYIDHSPSSYTSARPTDYVQSKFLTSATNNSAISSGILMTKQ